MALKKLARIRVAGQDKKGIIATVTTDLSRNNLNIEDIDQRILEDFLVMNMVVDITDLKPSLAAFKKDLARVGRGIGMEITLEPIERRKIKNVAILVTKEAHCLVPLLRAMRSGKISGRPAMILANRPDLKPLAKKYRVLFGYTPSTNRQGHEKFLVKRLAEQEVDLIVLARFMQILSPEFCFRYEGKILNIHPSLLPSFPGARAYSQAYNKGVEVVGVTAHFVTTDLDEGPIICQDAFKIDKTRDSPETIAARGKKLEAEVLARAVKLFCDDRLTLRRGKVIDSRRTHRFEEQVKGFYL